MDFTKLNTEFSNIQLKLEKYNRQLENIFIKIKNLEKEINKLEIKSNKSTYLTDKYYYNIMIELKREQLLFLKQTFEEKENPNDK